MEITRISEEEYTKLINFFKYYSITSPFGYPLSINAPVTFFVDFEDTSSMAIENRIRAYLFCFFKYHTIPYSAILKQHINIMADCLLKQVPYNNLVRELIGEYLWHKW